MPRKRKVVKSHVRAKAKPRATVLVMIKRYQKKLDRLKEQQRLQAIKKEVADLQDLIKRGF